MAMRTCNPAIHTVDGLVCEFVIICQRCGFCLVHCSCPPIEQRAQGDDFRRVVRRGALSVELK